MKKRMLFLLLISTLILMCSVNVSASDSEVGSPLMIVSGEERNLSELIDVETIFSWEIENTDVVRVDSNGILAALSAGTAEIIAYAEDGTMLEKWQVTVLPEPISVVFSDVTESDWFYPYVDFVTQFGLFNGVGNGQFAPNSTMTRGMVVTVLYRMEGEPGYSVSNPFSDVPSGQWYTDAVIWAYENGVVNGMSENTYAPNANVTREQFVTILYRYAGMKGLDVSDMADVSSFPDDQKISSYASDAFRWAYAEMIINGKATNDGNYLAPQDNTTRAEVSKMLAKFVTEQYGVGQVTSIDIEKESYIINVPHYEQYNTSVEIDYTIFPEYALNELQWTSDDAGKVEVLNDKIVPYKAGGVVTLTISASNGVSDSCDVTLTGQTSYFNKAFIATRDYILENYNASGVNYYQVNLDLGDGTMFYLGYDSYLDDIGIDNKHYGQPAIRFGVYKYDGCSDHTAVVIPQNADYYEDEFYASGSFVDLTNYKSASTLGVFCPVIYEKGDVINYSYYTNSYYAALTDIRIGGAIDAADVMLASFHIPYSIEDFGFLLFR